jgi:hypothetical protein
LESEVVEDEASRHASFLGNALGRRGVEALQCKQHLRSIEDPLTGLDLLVG